ncbi:histidine phosphatase family protein [Cytobacillus sp. NCCP-133]|uniref:histidine phosphatase family protein n=1 Tax=Cytobacillus sp. NCCP-133 TaxID=766848 RepID=UPI00222E7009|nr:histidine phosphatase family protein [Cytobacillus sp. NCCP-133]GLB60953.1 hypothetical protein NCCP133_30850 [Cytobacillus sp. NCCP-133]
MDDRVVIALFRHGITEANKRHAYLGWTDSSLCPINQNLIKVSAGYELILSSDLGRCRQTANILFPGTTPDASKDWREIHFGKWEGKTYEELKDNADYRSWLEIPFTHKPPNGESFGEFTERVDRGWNKLIHRMLDEEIRTAAIVTHGGVMRYLLSKYAPEAKEFWEWQVPFGKGYEFSWKQEGLRRGERCTLLREVPLTANPSG